MRAAASLAGHPGQTWIQDVVNWGALWLVVPVLGARASPDAGAAAVLGSVTGVIEVLAYYGPMTLTPAKLFWVAVGAPVCGLIAVIDFLTRRSPIGRLLVPALLVFEPLLWFTVLTGLGRDLSPYWLRGASAEVVIGVLVGVVVLSYSRVVTRRHVR